jgi:hypothetical protein
VIFYADVDQHGGVNAGFKLLIPMVRAN